jgi:hypothetical protein
VADQTVPTVPHQQILTAWLRFAKKALSMIPHLESNKPLAQPGLRSWLQKSLSGYKTIAIILLNTIVLFILFNLALGFAFWLRGPEPGNIQSNPALRYSEASLAAVYPGWTREERNEMLRENWSRPLVYDDFVLHRERPCRGKYVNVTEAGFRLSKNQGPWPPSPTNLNIFLFGGSTTYGYGLPDWQTIPSFLQEALSRHTRQNVRVYNFGSSSYYSEPERIRFETLLASGHRPHIVVFIDGLNECNAGGGGSPFRHNVLHVFDTPSYRPSTLTAILRDTPTGRLIRGLQRRSNERKPRDVAGRVSRAIERYQASKKMVEGMCKEFSIAPLLIWQPVPDYKYDMKHHLFAGPGTWSNQIIGYSMMEKLLRAGVLGTNFVWCADLQENEKECLYVDSNHYTAKFSQRFAEIIAQEIASRGLIARLDTVTSIDTTRDPLPR